MDRCVFKQADTSQRNHTCWFDTAIVTLANSNILQMNSVEESRGILKTLSDSRSTSSTSIGKDIQVRGGLSDYSKKLHAKISRALGDDVCPLKPTEGQDMLTFLQTLIEYVDISHISLKTSTGNKKSIEGNSEFTCANIGQWDLYDYVSENFSKAINFKKFSGESGVLLVQFRGSDGACSKLDCKSSFELETPVGNYMFTLRTMTISNRGHVMAIGRCRNDTEWTVFDNEFSGNGYSPRTFEAEDFEKVKSQMLSFPHSFFSPKVGVIQMNPFFKTGIRSATVFFYDFVRV